MLNSIIIVQGKKDQIVSSLNFGLRACASLDNNLQFFESSGTAGDPNK